MKKTSTKLRDIWEKYVTTKMISSYSQPVPQELIWAARIDPDGFKQLSLEVLKNLDDYSSFISLPDLYFIIYPELLKDYNKDYISYCEDVRNHLENTVGVEYYSNFRKYRKWLETNYKPWSPNIEEDPNKTYTQWEKENLEET